MEKYIPPNHLLSKQNISKIKYFFRLKDKQNKEFLLSDPRAIRSMIACMDMEAALGGAASHWGGPSAFVEIMSSIYTLIFSEGDEKNLSWFERFHFINDAGHCENALYALKANYDMAGIKIKDLKKFRSIETHLTGHGEAHLFPEGVYLSNGPLGSVLSQAQGLAMADAVLKKERLCIVTMSDGAFMEGEAKESLASIPGFAKKSKLNPFLLIISDNNTKLSGRIDEDSFSLEPSFLSLETLGWNVIKVEKGNDLKTVFYATKEALKEAWKNPKQPVVLWVKTCKGFGNQSTSESNSGGHGFPLKDPNDLQKFIQEIYGTEEVPDEFLKWCNDIIEKKSKSKEKENREDVILEKVQKGISKALIEKKKEGFPLVSITSDLFGSTGLGDFCKQFPQHTFDVGVAESNMIGIAAGFSKQGFIPLVDTFSQFAVTKGNLPLIMSSLSQAPLIGIFSHAGFQDAADGASHQSLSYLANTCSIPYLDVHVLTCSTEAYYLLSQAIKEFQEKRAEQKIPRSQIFFMGREVFPQKYPLLKNSYQLKKAQVIFEFLEGKNPVLIVTFGPLLKEALKAVENLKNEGYGSVLINNSCVNFPDVHLISFYLKECKGRLLIAEDHYLKGGFGNNLIGILSRKNHNVKVFKALGIDDSFGRSAYEALDLYKLFGLDSSSFEKTVKSFE